MKKNFRPFCGLLCGLAALCFAACAGEADVWQVTGVELLGQSISAEDFAAEGGADFTKTELQLYVNGKAILKMPNEETGGTVKVGGTWLETDWGCQFVYEDGAVEEFEFEEIGGAVRLVWEMGIARIIFSRASG